MRAPLLELVFIGALGSCAACSDGASDATPHGGPSAHAATARASSQDRSHARRLFPTLPPLQRLNDFVTPNGWGTWSEAAASAGDDATVAVVADAQGNFLVAGSLGGNADIGCGPHDAVNAAYVAKYTPAGACSWATYVDGNGFLGPGALALDAAGSVYFAGNFADAAVFDGAMRTSAGGLDGFVMKLVAGDGAVAWARTFGGVEDEYLYAIAVEGAQVAIGGAFNGTTSLGGPAVVSNGDADGFVAEYTSDGIFVAQHSFGAVGWDAVNALAFDPGGRLVANGTFVGTVLFGAQSLVSAGGQDAFLATYDAGLTPVLARSMGGAGDDAAHGLVVDAANVISSGYFQQSADLGGAAPLVGVGLRTGFLATYAGDLSFVRAAAIDSDGEVIPEAMTSDANGGVVLTGHFSGSAVFGTTTYAAVGEANGFVVAYASDGAFRWSTVFGDGRAEGLGVASAPGRAVIAGSFTGSVDFGAGAVTSGAGSRGLLWALVDNAP